MSGERGGTGDRVGERRTMSRGVAEGASSANHTGTSTPSTPASFIVGTSGISSDARAPATGERAQAPGFSRAADRRRVGEGELDLARDERVSDGAVPL